MLTSSDESPLVRRASADDDDAVVEALVALQVDDACPTLSTIWLTTMRMIR